MAVTSQVPVRGGTLRWDVAGGIGVALLLAGSTAFAGPRWGVVAALVLVMAAIFLLSLRGMLFFLAAIAPLQITIDTPGFGVQPTFIGAIAIFAICLAAIIRSGRLKGDPSKLCVLLSAFFGIAILSALVGIAPGWSLSRLIHIFAYLGLFLSAFWLLRGIEDAVRIVRLVVAVGVVVGIIGIGLHVSQFIVGKPAAEHLFMYRVAPLILGVKRAAGFQLGTVWGPGVVGAPLRAGGPFLWPAIFAQYIELVLPIILAKIAFQSRARPSWGTGFGAVVLIFCVVSTYMRGAWITFPVAALALWYTGRRAGLKTRPTIVAVLALAALVVFLSSSLLGGGAVWERLRATWQPDYASNLNRLQTWSVALEIIKAHPVFGVGPGNFAAARYDTPPQELAKPYNNADNLYLTITAEMGIVGLACFAFLMVRLVSCAAEVAKRSLDPESRIAAVGLAGSFVWIGLNSITSDSFYEHRLYAVFWILAAAVAVMYRSAGAKSSAS